MITVGICTRDRYDILSATLVSVALQTYSDIEIIVADDSEGRIDPREHLAYQHVFNLLNFKKIPFHWLYGDRKGQHHLHQAIQEAAKGDFIYRIDDDEVAEPDVLAKLAAWITHPQVGAVGGLVPQGPLQPEPLISKDWPVTANGLLADLGAPNLQWFSHGNRSMPIEVEHLHSSFLYRKGIAKFELGLSPAAHREETIFTGDIFKAGYKILIEPSAVTWHMRASTGGIRSHQMSPKFWDHDEKIFQERLKTWGITPTAETKYIVADMGMGDHVVFKSLIPELQAKYPKLIIAATFPDILEDKGLELISIAEAKRRLGDLGRHNIYVFMTDHAWTGSLRDAMKKFYGIED